MRFSSFSCLRMYSRTIASSKPTVLTQFPVAQKWPGEVPLPTPGTSPGRGDVAGGGARGVEVHSPRLFPPNDGAIALGQLAVARARRR